MQHNLAKLRVGVDEEMPKGNRYVFTVYVLPGDCLMQRVGKCLNVGCQLRLASKDHRTPRA